jgi:excisionase family DNA binding protein
MCRHRPRSVESWLRKRASRITRSVFRGIGRDERRVFRTVNGVAIVIADMPGQLLVESLCVELTRWSLIDASGADMTTHAPKAEPLLTPAEVAALFRVDPKTVTRWAKADKLTSIRTLGGHRRYRESEVRALLLNIPQPRTE